MASLPNRAPEVLAAIPSDPHTPAPATDEEWTVLCPAGQDPFVVRQPPVDETAVVLIDDEPSGQIFVDDPPAPDLGGVLMPTGMYKGQPLSAIPRNYLEWCITRNWCKPTPLGLTIVAYLGAGKGGAA